MPEEPVNIGIIGLGTVGTGVARILRDEPERIQRRAGRPLKLRRAVVRDLNKPRGIELPAGMLGDDPQAVINDPEIEVAVHLVGGIDPARQIMLDLLDAGKNVVTANKALLCEHGDELFARAREKGRTIAFEAAVAGGIPIISAINHGLTGNQITSISAILNGTSNFILTQMVQERSSYVEALRSAQELGYAEADPTMDIDGTDAAQKLVILAQLAFGVKVPLSVFPRQGIDLLDLSDLTYADELGYIVKLLASARLVNGRLELLVLPTLVRHHTLLAEVHGPFNAVGLTGDVVGETWYFGAGAGQMPTASAVIADLIDTVTGRTALTFPRLEVWRTSPPFEIQPSAEIARRFYLRFNVDDRPHVLADIADILGRHEISIASVIQHEAPETELRPGHDRLIVPLVIMTHRTTEGAMRAAEQEISRLPALLPPHIRMPVTE